MYKDFKLNRNLNKCKRRDLSFLNVDIKFLFLKKKWMQLARTINKRACVYLLRIFKNVLSVNR